MVTRLKHFKFKLKSLNTHISKEKTGCLFLPVAYGTMPIITHGIPEE